jgi:hypothetical protein
MSIFFCWSGERSRHVAETLARSLQSLNIQGFLSPQIPKGEVWFEAIRQQLASADAAIVTLTPENLGAPWLHYEAGAVAFGIPKDEKASRRIYTYLFGVRPGDVGSPLSQYQHTEATKGDTLALISQLLPAGTDREAWIEAHGDVWWSDFVHRLHGVAARSPTEVLPKLSDMFRRKTFDEPIAECVSHGWIDRYTGARETFHELKGALPQIRTQCRQYAGDLAEQLVRELDIYAMALRATLITEHRFKTKDEGNLDLPKSIENACERSRLKILQMQAALVDEARTPIFEDSPRFDRLESFARRKAFIHRRSAEIEEEIRENKKSDDWSAPKLIPPDDKLKLAQVSDWMLDRVLFYQTRLLQHELAEPKLKFSETLGKNGRR